MITHGHSSDSHSLPLKPCSDPPCQMTASRHQVRNFEYKMIAIQGPVSLSCRKVRYEVDGYVYNKNEEPKFIVSGNWNKSMSYQPCDAEGEPTPGTDLKEVRET